MIQTLKRLLLRWIESLVTATVNPNIKGTVSPASIVVPYGHSQIFMAKPDDGYEVDSWQVDGKIAQTGGNAFELNDVLKNHSVSITFQPSIPTDLVGCAMLKVDEKTGKKFWLTANGRWVEQMPLKESENLVIPTSFLKEGAYIEIHGRYEDNLNAQAAT